MVARVRFPVGSPFPFGHIRTRTSYFLCAFLLVSLLGCKTTYYAAYETFGVHKRDLLKKRVVAARDEQQAAGKEFKDAMTRLKELSGFQGGDLERTYNNLKSDYDQASSRADAVHKRVKDMDTVAKDLFAEWERELNEISSPTLRTSSQTKLRETRGRYEEMHRALQRAEQSMEPVLTRFKDQVLYLKHNLNAAAIASLKGESLSIQTDISKLIEEMNTAISQADKFVAELK